MMKLLGCRIWLPLVFLATMHEPLLWAADQDLPRVRITPAVGHVGTNGYLRISGKHLDGKNATAVQIRAISIPSATTANPTVSIDNSRNIKHSVGLSLQIPDKAAPGRYLIQLLKGTGASITILAEADFTILGPLADANTYNTPTIGQTGCVSAAAAPSTSTGEKVGVVCTQSFLTDKEAKDDFGSRIADRYYAIQIGVANNSDQYDFLVRGIVLHLPDGRVITSRVKRFAEGVSIKGKAFDTRNVIFNALRAAGGFAGGLTVFRFASTDFKNATNIFQGTGLQGFENIFPDFTVDQVARFANSVFDDSQALLVPKRSIGQPPRYVIALLPRHNEDDETLPSQISTSIDGTFIRAVALVSLSESRVDFIPRTLGNRSDTHPISVVNNNGSALTMVHVGFRDANGNLQPQSDNFDSSSNDCSNTIAANSHCTINLVFAPTQEGPRQAKLIIEGNFSDSPIEMPITGFGIPLSVTQPASAAADFKVVPIGIQKSFVVTVRNVSSVNPITNLIFSLPAGFQQDSTTCTATLAANATCDYTIAFAPTLPNLDYTGSLTITGDSFKSFPVSVKLSGSASHVTITPPAALNFGTVAANTSAMSQSISVHNDGRGTLTPAVNVPSGNGVFQLDPADHAGKCGGTIAAGETCNLFLIFRPNATGHVAGTVTFGDASNNVLPNVAITLSGDGS